MKDLNVEDVYSDKINTTNLDVDTKLKASGSYGSNEQVLTSNGNQSIYQTLTGTQLDSVAMPLSGGTMTGDITFANTVFTSNGSTNHVKILQVFREHSTVDYTTTSNTAYSAAGPFASIQPRSNSSNIIIKSKTYIMAYQNNGNIGTQARLEYYDGTAYVDIGLPRAIYMENYDQTSTMWIDGHVECGIKLTQAHKRSDLGLWTVRWYFNVIQSGNTGRCRYADFIAIEYLD